MSLESILHEVQRLTEQEKHTAMPYRVRFLQDADKDISKAIAWYRDIGEGHEPGF